jgi:hypothetical protein
MTVTGESTEAASLLRDAVAGLEALTAPSPVLLAQARIALAHALARMGERTEAGGILEAVRPELDALPEALRGRFESVEAEVRSKD